MFSILTNLGFNKNFIRIIKNVVNTVTFFVLVNGAPSRLFSSSQGLWQGVPLSPSLFIIVEEVLSINLVCMANFRRIKGVKPTSQCPPKIIQQFVDETFLFRISFVHEVREWKVILNQYAMVSRKFINY